jgi:hypothetical protein
LKKHMKNMRQIFIDANIFTYLLTGHPVHGRACQKLLEKVENGDLEAYISPHRLDVSISPRHLGPPSPAIDSICPDNIFLLKYRLAIADTGKCIQCKSLRGVPPQKGAKADL